MAKATLEFNLGDVTKKLTSIETRLADPSDLTRDLLLLAIRSTQLNFESEGRPQRWDDLAQSTIERRFAKVMKTKAGKKAGSLGSFGSIRILQNTGHLKQSLGFGANGPFNKFGGEGVSDQFTATLSTSHPGAWNQFPNTRTGAPARVMVLWQTADEEDALAMAEDFLLARGPYAI